MTMLAMLNQVIVFIYRIWSTKEIHECNIHQYTEYGYKNCIGVNGEMYRTETNHKGGDSYSLAVSFDGERFLFNESKVEKFLKNSDFKHEESASCLPYHMVENNMFYCDHEFYERDVYCQLLNATDTRLLWLIRSPRKCENRNCPIREGFYILVEQDFLVNSRDGNGNELKQPLRTEF